MRAGGREARGAAERYESAVIDPRQATIRLQWQAMDAWFEEDEEVFTHARDPHTRVDILASSNVRTGGGSNPAGNLIIGNTHAGPDNPQLIEVTRDKQVVWSFRSFETFGNDMAAAEVLDIRNGFRYLPGRVRRLLGVDSLLKKVLRADWNRVVAGECTPATRWWRNALTQDAAYRTAGMVEILIQRSEELYGRSPLDAFAVSEIAVEIADAISIVAYPYDHVAKIRGRALREKAYLLSYLGRLPEAKEVAELSDRYLQQIPVPPPEVARLDLVRSNIAREQRDYDDAVAFARRAAETFLWFGNRGGWLKARSYEAVARLGAGDYRQALDVCRSMEPYLDEMTPEHRAARLHNMGLCATENREFDEAARAYAGAAEAFVSLGNIVNGVKCRRSAGYSFLCAGKPAKAIPLLESAREKLEELGMEMDAALAALQLVEALMLVGDTEEVPEICRNLIERFTRAGIRGGAMTALAFLRETVAVGHATPASVKHVHEFIQITRIHGERPFVAPPEQPRGVL